jgi:hypothetical protein
LSRSKFNHFDGINNYVKLDKDISNQVSKF